MRISGIVKHNQADFLAFDGTIYNHLDLLDLIKRHGVVAAVKKLNADFALAYYDQAADVLWLARDRFGVMPLYYVQDKKIRAFASQPRALAKVASMKLVPDEGFIARYAGNHYRGIDQDPAASPYKNIAQVPPATVIRLGPKSRRQYKYWSLSEQPDWTAPPEQLAEEYKALLLDAVQLRLAKSGKSAFTLSGGMDSSTVVASATQITGRPQPAFSAVYNDPTFDESVDIQPMLAKHVRPWKTVRIGNPDVFPLIKKMIAIHDEPIVTATWLSHYLLVQKVAKVGYKTLWGGLGGDELNAGEYEYFMYYFADLAAAGETKKLKAEIAAWVKYHDHPVWRKSAALVARRIAEINQVDTGRLWRYHPALNPEWAQPAKEFLPLPYPFSSYLKNRTFQDLTRETLPCCLRAEDRHAAAFGLQRRLPFLDYRLAEFMFRVPGDLKIRQGVTKYLLREATRGLLPEATRTRIKKTGWNAPAHQWFMGKGREQLLDLVNSRSFQQRGIYNVPEVMRLINQHGEIVRSGRPQENHMMFLWQLVNLELWLQSI